MISEGVEIDTAQSYGDAESVIGATFKKMSNPFGRVTTKLKSYGLGKTPSDIRRSIEVSKQKLGSSVHMNILLHDSLDFFGRDSGTWDVLRSAQTDGVVERIGASIDKPEFLAPLLQDPSVSALQFPANILDYRWEESPAAELLQARNRQAKTYARSIFLQGILLATSQGWPAFGNTDPERILSVLDGLANDLGRENRLDLLVGWAKGWAKRFQIDALVIGVLSEAQWLEIVKCFSNDALTPDALDHCRNRLPRVATEFLNPSNWGEGA